MKKHVRVVALLALIAVLVAGVFALSACGKTGDKSGGKGGGDSQSGGVFSPDMSYESYLGILYSMTSWTTKTEYLLEQDGGFADTTTMLSSVNGTDSCCVYDMGDGVEHRQYAFEEDGVYYWIEVYDDEQGFIVHEALKSNDAKDFLTLFVPREWADSNAQLYSIVGDKERYFPENICDFTVMVYMLVMTKYVDGEFVPNYAAVAGYGGGYGEGYEWEFVFENNGISMKTHGVYTDRQGNSSVENSQWSLTDVGETEVVIPDEIKALKSQCTFVTE